MYSLLCKCGMDLHAEFLFEGYIKSFKQKLRRSKTFETSLKQGFWKAKTCLYHFSQQFHSDCHEMYIGLSYSAYRLLLKKSLLLPNHRGFTSRALSSTGLHRNWRNETPPGGLTEILVYSPESQIAWPDTTLGVFAQADPQFILPGNVGLPGHDKIFDINKSHEVGQDGADHSDSDSISSPRLKIDILEDKTNRENQAQTLYSANDYIQYTQEESYVCSNPVLINTFPPPDNMEKCKFELHEAPQLLRKEFGPLFPGVEAFHNPNNAVTVLTMAQETKSDMSMWSNQMEEEREMLTDKFVGLAKEFCGR